MTFLRAVVRLVSYLLRFFLGQKKDNRCKPCPPALRKPDPFLYSQSYLMGLGLPVTWDNPDIFLFDGTNPVDPHDLHASTAYTVVARIWNASLDIPVMDLDVEFSYLSFGMGTVSHSIGSATVDLNAKGLPGCPAFASVTWTTPAVLGHYCIQVLLNPPDDSNWLNNLGQRNTDVAQPASPAAFHFTVGNHRGPRARRVQFAVDSYAIPPLPTCDRVAKERPALGRESVPVASGWEVALTPERFDLDPGFEQLVTAAITPPPGFVGSMPFNVTAIDDGGPFGGVTLLVDVPA